jgi:hypothetical protein
VHLHRTSNCYGKHCVRFKCERLVTLDNIRVMVCFSLILSNQISALLRRATLAIIAPLTGIELGASRSQLGAR